MHERRYPKEVILKSGEEVVLKIMEPLDQKALCGFYKELKPSILWYMKENPCNEGVVAKWIKNQSANRAFSTLAVYEERIVAHAALLMRPQGGRRHVGRLRVYVANEFRRKQLGTWMVFDLIRYAMDRGLEMIRTDLVVGVDDLAIKAVRKLDFVTEGVIRDYVRDEKGNRYDYQIMIKQLHSDWGEF